MKSVNGCSWFDCKTFADSEVHIAYSEDDFADRQQLIRFLQQKLTFVISEAARISIEGVPLAKMDEGESLFSAFPNCRDLTIVNSRTGDSSLDGYSLTNASEVEQWLFKQSRFSYGNKGGGATLTLEGECIGNGDLRKLVSALKKVRLINEIDASMMTNFQKICTSTPRGLNFTVKFSMLCDSIEEFQVKGMNCRLQLENMGEGIVNYYELRWTSL